MSVVRTPYLPRMKQFSVYVGAKLTDIVHVAFTAEPNDDVNFGCNHAKAWRDHEFQFYKQIEILLKVKTEEILFLLAENKRLKENETKLLNEINLLKSETHTVDSTHFKGMNDISQKTISYSFVTKLAESSYTLSTSTADSKVSNEKKRVN